MNTYLITGDLGFIGTNLARKMLKEYPNDKIIGIDRADEDWNIKNINSDYHTYIGDFTDQHFVERVFKIEKPDYVLHLGAKSFVCSAQEDATPFSFNNAHGTQIMVNVAVKYGVKKFLYCSSDEIYGHLESKTGPSWTEESPINPRNPYSATKASGELIVRAAANTHDLPMNISRCCNNFGQRQAFRNLIPKVFTSILSNQPIPIHGNGSQIREWIYVDDHNSALLKILHKAPINEIYNIGTGVEYSNLETTNIICDLLGKGKDLITFVKDRKNHDKRYSVNCDKIKKLEWTPKYTFEQGLNICAEWYKDNYK